MNFAYLLFALCFTVLSTYTIFAAGLSVTQDIAVKTASAPRALGTVCIEFCSEANFKGDCATNFCRDDYHYTNVPARDQDHNPENQPLRMQSLKFLKRGSYVCRVFGSNDCNRALPIWPLPDYYMDFGTSADTKPTVMDDLGEWGWGGDEVKSWYCRNGDNQG